MKIIRAKVLDARHLELVEPLPEGLGPYVELSLASQDEDEVTWREAALKHFEDAYAPEDAIYDEL
jgi:hypothetical protein